MSRRALAAVVALLAFSGTAVAAPGLGIAPVRLDLAAGERAAVFTVSNGGDEAMDVQVRALAWQQHDDADAYTADDAIIVSPSRLTIPPRAERMVRFYLDEATPVAHERAYRVHVDQLLPADAPASAVQMPLRLLVPMFVAGSAMTPPALSFAASPEGDDAIRLRIRNAGGTHVRIGAIALDAATTPPPAALLYVLAGAERTIVLPRPASLPVTATVVPVRGDGDHGPWHGEAVLAPR